MTDEYTHMSNDEVQAMTKEIINSIDNVNNLVELDNLLTDLGM